MNVRLRMSETNKCDRIQEVVNRLPYTQREVCHVYNGGIENSPGSI